MRIRVLSACTCLVWTALQCCAGEPSRFAMSLATADGSDEPFQVEFSVHTGPTSGYIQTPAGGAPGTSDTKRPTLDELNMGDAVYYDVEAVLPVGPRTKLYTGAQWIEESGSGTLAAPLVSHGVSFAAGAPFDATANFDWYRVGAKHSFDLAGPSLQLVPKVEFALLDFNYELTSPGQSASRSYAMAAGRVGAELNWQASQRVSLLMEGSASIPYPDTMPMIATAGGEVDVVAFETSNVRVTLFAGAGVLFIDYQDNQDLPNHIHLEVAPSYEAGCRIFW